MKSRVGSSVASIALVFAGATMLSACGDRSASDRTTSIPRGADVAAVTAGVTADGTSLGAPPAPAERTPIAPNANTMAPGTDAKAAFGPNATRAEGTLPANDDALAVKAQEAAVRAPDTASGDAAKKAILESAGKSAGTGQTARDTAANSPRHGALTPSEESTQMPKAGQANNHSSPSLEKDSGR